MAVNVFFALSMYGSSQEENYLTESFVFLINLLIERMPNEGVRFLNRLTGPLPFHSITQPRLIVIRTQAACEQGRPDIEIREAEDTLVYVEIKHDSPIGYGQLEYYLRQLHQSGHTNVRLVLLTRSRASANETTLAPADYHHVCWYEIYNWLADISHSDEVSQYFINAFMNFLEEKNMNLKKVTWEYMQGIESLLNLTTMMETAAKEIMPEMTFNRTSGWSWRGFSLDNKTYFFGLRFNRPSLIVFENNQGTNPSAKCELDLEVTHFFALTKDEQFELLVNFLKRAKAEVSKGNTTIELSDNDSADI